MDYLNSYTATLLEQSRFYFPPLAAVRNALQETRPPLVVPGESPSAPPVATGVQSLTPFMELGLLHAGSGAIPREREIPLDLSMKTIRQTPDSTADDDVIVLEQRRNSVRNHALQMAAAAAAAAAAGKLPFTFGNTPGGSQGPRLGDPFLHQSPHPSMFAHDSLLPPTPVTSAASMVTSPAYRCPQPTDGGSSSAFLTPPSSIHAAVCGGLNGFCLDPHRCRLASLSAAAMAAGASSSAASARQHPSAAFSASSPFSTLSLPSAAAVAAAAMYERHLAKLMPSSGSPGAASMLQGLSDLRMPSSIPPSSSSSTTTPTSTSSSDVLKHPFPTGGALPTDRYLSSFGVPSVLGLPMYHSQHPSSHPHSKDVPSSCTCCLPKPYPIPCLCCYPSAVPPRAYDGHPQGAMFSCCPVPPPSVAVTPVPNVASSETKEKVKKDRDPVTSTAPSSGGHNHHHHHHHHHHNSSKQSPCTKDGHESSSKIAVVNGTSTGNRSSSTVQGSASSMPPTSASHSVQRLATKDEPSQCKISSNNNNNPHSPPHHRPPTPTKPQPEGGRWVPRPHSHSHKDKSTSAAPSSGHANSKINKVFAPVVHIQQSSSPSAQVPSKVVTPSPVALSSTPTSATLTTTTIWNESLASASMPSPVPVMTTPPPLPLENGANDNEPQTASLPPTESPHHPRESADVRSMAAGAEAVVNKQQLDSKEGLSSLVIRTAHRTSSPKSPHQMPDHPSRPSSPPPPPPAAAKTEVDVAGHPPVAVVPPATIERWMLSPPSVKTENTETVKERSFSWNPFDPPRHHHHHHHHHQQNHHHHHPGHAKDGSVAPPRIWNQNYAEDGGSSAVVVAPVVPPQKPNAGSDLPASPAEGCSPTSLEPKGAGDGVNVASQTAAVAVPSSTTGDAPGATPPSMGISSTPPLTAKTLTPVVVVGGSLYGDEDLWKTPLKRSASDLATLQVAAKKKKKDVIVISMRDEHHLTQKVVPPLQSVKRKLSDDQLMVHHHASSSEERLSSSSSSSSSIPSMGATAVATPRAQHAFLQTFEPPSSSQQPLVNPFFAYKTSSEVAAMVTSSGRSVVEKQQPPHDQEQQQPRFSLPTSPLTAFKDVTSGGNASYDPLKCGSSSRIGGPPLVVVDDVSRRDVGGVNVSLDEKSSDRVSANDRKNGDGSSEARLPPVGVTLVKTTTSGVSQYKSSILSSNHRNNGCSTSSEDATTAMLRLYYEQQKQRLQQQQQYSCYTTQQDVKSTSTNAPTTTTTSSSSTSVGYTFPVSGVATASFKSAYEDVWLKRQQQTSAFGPPMPRTAQLLKDEKEEPEEEEEDDDDDDDDSSSDDNVGDDSVVPDGKLTTTESGSPEVNITVAQWHQGELQDVSSEKVEEAVKEYGSSPSRTSPAPSTPAARTPSPSSASTTSVTARVESTKRLMINKALGETMLHRAARLGYLDVLTCCLKAQGSSSVDVRDNAGYTPLHECCSRGHLEIARLLLQHGADPNASATGGIRPIHDAVENDQVEVVRLLLSYGADPVIATYSGLTPLKIARSPTMTEFLKGYLADVSGDADVCVLPWQFHGSARFFDPWPTGYDPLNDLPSDDESVDMDDHDDDDVDSAAALVFEVSDKPHIPTYRVPTSHRNGSGMLSFCLLQDVLNQTGMDRDAFLSCYPDIQVETMPRQEFASRARCTELMVDVSASLGACPATPWVDLVRWDDTLRDILDIERVTIPRMDSN